MLKSKRKLFVIIIIVVFIVTVSIYICYRMGIFSEHEDFHGLTVTYSFSITKYKKGSTDAELYKYIVIYISENGATLQVNQPEKPYRKERKLSEKEVKLFEAFIKKNNINGLPSYPRTPGGFQYTYFYSNIGAGYNRVVFCTASEKKNVGYGLLINKFLELANTGDFKTVNIKWKDILAGK